MEYRNQPKRKHYLSVDEYIYPLIYPLKILNVVEALVLNDINHFTNNYEYYYKKNEVIASEMNVSIPTVTRIITKLENELQFIETKKISRGRLIKTTRKLSMFLSKFHQNVPNQFDVVSNQNDESASSKRLGMTNQNDETINKEENKEKNIEKYKKQKTIFFENIEVQSLFDEFLDFRKSLKAKNTERAIKLLVNELSKYDDETKIEMMSKSIMNSWKSVYPTKGHNNKTSSRREERISMFDDKNYDASEYDEEFENALKELELKE